MIILTLISLKTVKQLSVLVVLLLVNHHGSKKKASNDMLFSFAEIYKKASGRTLVEVAHMELAAPSIPDALERCVARRLADGKECRFGKLAYNAAERRYGPTNGYST